MRIVLETSRPEFKITVFFWNSKYLVKFEQGPLEQTYKFSELDAGNEAAIKKLIIDEAFLKNAQLRFEEMRQTYNQARETL